MQSESHLYFERSDRSDLAASAVRAITKPGSIGWISTLAPDGSARLSAFDDFGLVGTIEPAVMFAGSGISVGGFMSNAINHARRSRDFTANLANADLRHQLSATDWWGQEFEAVGVMPAPGRSVGCPRVAESPISVECRVVGVVDLPCLVTDVENVVVFGHITGIHIDPRIITPAGLDPTKIVPIPRSPDFDLD
ncbi:MAG: hypothetical protein F4Y67_01035 [Chloroflexi bacterium]|nr:hypothetical protein [Chloroflexota bacterium]